MLNTTDQGVGGLFFKTPLSRGHDHRPTVPLPSELYTHFLNFPGFQKEHRGYSAHFNPHPRELVAQTRLGEELIPAYQVTTPDVTDWLARCEVARPYQSHFEITGVCREPKFGAHYLRVHSKTLQRTEMQNAEKMGAGESTNQPKNSSEAEKPSGYSGFVRC